MTMNVNETPTLAGVIRDAIASRLADVHVSLPARIVSYDAATQKAEVQPEIKRTFIDGTSADLPIIVDVPVAWPRAGKAYLHMPLKAGDQVMLVFSERSLDEWKNRGGSVKPKELRKFSISDAWAVPGGYPFSNVVPASASDLTLVHDKTEFVLKSSGKFQLKGAGGEEMVKILSEFMEIASRATTNTIFGPMRWNEFSEIIALKARLDKLKV